MLTGQSTLGQAVVSQGRARRHRAGRRRTGQRRTGQRRTGPRRTGPRLVGPQQPTGRRLLRLATILAAVLVVAAAVIVAVRLLSPGSPPCQTSVVPAYFAPAPGWDQAVSGSHPPGVMILDISGSGAGSVPVPSFQAAVKRATAAGVTVLGYAGTDYGRRPSVQIETDIRNYRSWYGITGIFLDQTPSSAAELGYYRGLADVIHQVNPGAQIWLNPGVYPDKAYMSVGNVIMVYEGPYANYQKLPVPAWASKYSSTRFAHTVYATPASQLAHVISISRSRNAGNVYVTDGSGSNPYSALPSYWTAEESALSARC